MIGTIRKHSTVLWVVIIVVVVIAFVFWGVQSPQGPSTAGRYGTINGETVTEKAFNDARREVLLRYLMMLLLVLLHHEVLLIATPSTAHP